MTAKQSVISRGTAAALLVAMLVGPTAHADSGFFIGASIGDASTSISDIDLSGNNFNDSASAWKGFAGYIFDLPVVDFGIEAGYVDFGSTSESVLGTDYDLSVTGLSGFGTVGLDFGLFGIFAKAGMVSWDADISIDNLSGKDSGSDPAYGAGMRLTFSSVEVRAEYEVFQPEEADVEMVSLGVVWRF